MNYLIILSIKFDKDIAAVHMYIFTTAADKDHYKFTPVTTNSPSDLLTYDGTNIKATLNENRWGTLSLIPIGYNDN